MELKGYCYGGNVKFTVQTPHPYLFNHYYCPICRKTAGGAGMPLPAAQCLHEDHRISRA